MKSKNTMFTSTSKSGSKEGGMRSKGAMPKGAVQKGMKPMNTSNGKPGKSSGKSPARGC